MIRPVVNDLTKQDIKDVVSVPVSVLEALSPVDDILELLLEPLLHLLRPRPALPFRLVVRGLRNEINLKVFAVLEFLRQKV